MTKLLTGLAVGAAMFLGLGAAQAEPLKLTGPQMERLRLFLKENDLIGKW